MLKITEQEFPEIIKTGKVIVVFEGDPWCSFCMAQKPVMEAFVNDYPNVNFVSINYANNKEREDSPLCQRLGVKALPDTLYFDEGKLLGKTSGYFKAKGDQFNRDRICNAINDLVKGVWPEVKKDNLKISKAQRDAIVQYLDTTKLPHADVKEICTLLLKLEEII